jgi:ATP-dependent exoDNAse (exonuclease V) beta subunit
MKQEGKNFIVYKSSAGSGKTFTLVKEYLRIVLVEPDKYRNILAITFTNKAANEMKERVVRYLGELAGTSPSSGAMRHLLPALEKETGLDKNVIAKRAMRVLSLIMHNYSEFAISTIDSFLHRVVRTFAHDLHLPMNFEVEVDEDTILEQAIGLLVNEIGSDEKISRVMVEFVRKKADDEANWNVEQDLLQMSRVLLKEEAIPYLESLKQLRTDDFIKIRQSLFTFIVSFENRITEKANEALRLVYHKGIDHSAFFQGNKGIMGYFKNLVEKEIDSPEPSGYAKQTIENDQWYKKATDPNTRELIDSIIPELKKIYEAIQDIFRKDGERYFTFKLIEKKIFPLAVLNEIERTLIELKEENNIVLISEFSRRINKIIQSEPVPFIYERLGERYHHYLLDEFQDTSVLQWHNLLPLLENSLASGHFSMVVGDGKQAIYRFRSGEVEQLDRLPVVMNKEGDRALAFREQVLTRNFESRNLAQNFRSNLDIVEFNNRFFKQISEYLPESYRSIYSDVEQLINRKQFPGMARLEFLKPDPDSLKYPELVLEKIKEIVAELKDDGFSLSDIAILCRKNKEASKAAAFLLQNGIPVISSESLLISQSSKVNFIISWILLLLNPADDIARAAILNFLVLSGQLGETDLHGLLKRMKPAAETSETSSPVLSTLAGLSAFLKKRGLECDPAGFLRLDLYQLVEELIRVFVLNDRADPYLQFFQDVILDFSRKRQVHLGDFIDWWEEHKDNLSIIVPEGVNAIRIMTIHKAKGLEFPVVIYPYADTAREKTKNDIWVYLDDKGLPELKAAYLPVSKQMEFTPYRQQYHEEMDKCMVDLVNLLYVAMTRPAERIYMLMKYPPKDPGDTDSLPKIISRFLKEIELWKEDDLSYIFGKAGKREIIPVKEVKEQVHYREYRPLDWSGGVLLRFHAPEVWDMENPEKNKEWGNLFHLVLSKIRYADEKEDVLASLVDDGILDEQNEMLLRYKIDNLFENPEIGRFFKREYEVKTEAEIIRQDGSLYRPDRLVFKGKTVSILDYKTGKPNEKYLSQLRQYSSLLKQMGYHVTGAFLVYLEDNPELVRVDEAG